MHRSGRGGQRRVSPLTPSDPSITPRSKRVVLGSPDPRIMAGPGIGEGKHGKSQGHHDANKAPQRSAEEGWARGGSTQSHVAGESWGEWLELGPGRCEAERPRHSEGNSGVRRTRR